MGLLDWFRKKPQQDEASRLYDEQRAIQEALKDQFLFLFLDIKDSAKAGGFSRYIDTNDQDYVLGNKHSYEYNPVLGAIDRSLVIVLEAKAARILRRANADVLEVNLRKLKSIVSRLRDLVAKQN